VDLIVQNVKVDEVDVSGNRRPQPAPFQFLDIGAGTGALGLALVNAWKKDGGNVHMTAIDISPQACELTNENAQLFNLSESVTVKHQSFQDFVNAKNAQWDDQTQKFDLIVSNPPYIPSDQVDRLDAVVLNHEDRGALDGGSDGMDIIREILRHSPALLKSGGELWMEVDPIHPEMIHSFVEGQGSSSGPDVASLHAASLEFLEAIDDFAGLKRFVRLRRQQVE